MTPPVQIAVYNRASTPLGFDLAAFVAAAQNYLDQCYTPHWSQAAELALTDGPQAGHYGCVFMDNADEPGALAYHDVEHGLPLSKVFVQTTLADHCSVTVSATHELVEMLTDPPCTRFLDLPDGAGMVAIEACDPVEESSFPLDGFLMSNFVLPAWFDPDAHDVQTQFDYLGLLKAPFSLAHGGYMVTEREGQIQNVFGSTLKENRYGHQDRRGRRGWHRKQGTLA